MRGVEYKEGAMPSKSYVEALSPSTVAYLFGLSRWLRQYLQLRFRLLLPV
jgi:hypothetical protein